MQDATPRTTMPGDAPPADEAAPPTGAVTGVATGALGTGTALDDTQEYDVADWLGARDDGAPAMAADGGVHAAPISATISPAATPDAAFPANAVAPAAAVAAPMSRVPAPRTAHPAAPLAAALATPVPQRPAARRSTVGPREAGVLAAILLVLVGAFALTNGGFPATGVPPAGADATPTIPTVTDAPDDGGDGDDGDGDGGGGGNGNGNGNGRGGGNGNGNGNGGGGGND